MENKSKKKLIIILIYVLLFILFIWFIYSIAKPEETCRDGIRNQNEEEIDCGGVCGKCTKIPVQEMTTGEKGVVESSLQGSYDFYGMVINPNKVYGSSDFSYKITFKDESGNILAEKSGKNFILPGESKYIIELNVASESFPSQVEFSVSDPQWKEFEYYERPDLKVINKTINEVTSGTDYIRANGLLRNESPFDFNDIKIYVILKDANNKIIAVNFTTISTVRSDEEREFPVSWPSSFPGKAVYMEVQPEVNVYNSDAFYDRYFGGQSF